MSKTFSVLGDRGRLEVYENGEIQSRTGYPEIALFDVREFRTHYGRLQDTDIRLIGWWDAQDVHHPPDTRQRELVSHLQKTIAADAESRLPEEERTGAQAVWSRDALLSLPVHASWRDWRHGLWAQLSATIQAPCGLPVLVELTWEDRGNPREHHSPKLTLQSLTEDEEPFDTKFVNLSQGRTNELVAEGPEKILTWFAMDLQELRYPGAESAPDCDFSAPEDDF